MGTGRHYFSRPSMKGGNKMKHSAALENMSSEVLH
jgi:hypothetical protein